MINGGFGLVLDGTPEAEQKARMMLSWDVSNGVSPLNSSTPHYPLSSMALPIQVGSLGCGSGPTPVKAPFPAPPGLPLFFLRFIFI